MTSIFKHLGNYCISTSFNCICNCLLHIYFRQVANDRGHVLPGDELILECDYNTDGNSRPIFGGLSTREEMCLGFMLYYPRSPLADCR